MCVRPMCILCAPSAQVHPLDLHGALLGIRVDHHRCLLGYDGGGPLLGGTHARRALRHGSGGAGCHGTHGPGDAHAQAITVSVGSAPLLGLGVLRYFIAPQL